MLALSQADGGGGLGTVHLFSPCSKQTYFMDVLPKLHVVGFLKKLPFPAAFLGGEARCVISTDFFALFSLGAPHGWPSHSATFPVPQVVLRRTEPRRSGGHADESSPRRGLPDPEAGRHRLLRHHLQVSGRAGACREGRSGVRRGRRRWQFTSASTPRGSAVRTAAGVACGGPALLCVPGDSTCPVHSVHLPAVLGPPSLLFGGGH